MEGLFDFIYDHIPDGWFDGFHKAWGDSLTDDVVIQSVQEASDFFNMNAPMSVHEDWTTGVITGMAFTENDDILVFNRQQMQEMGITDKEGFDLVMTHEGAHRALQGMETGFNSHQEELCCDYMAGVRAGLNGMDESKMMASLENTVESPSHPDGERRLQAIEAGVAFAHEYRESHNGMPPTFSDCLENFENSDLCANAWTEESGQINLRPEYAFAEMEDAEEEKLKGFVNDRSYHFKEAQADQESAEWHHKQANEAIVRGDLSSARNHNHSAESFERSRREHLDAAGRCTK